MRSFRLLIFWFPVVIYSGIIFWVSSISRIETPLPEFNFDKVLHVFEYMPFGYLFARALMKTKAGIRKKTVVIAASLASLLYGLSDEFHQSFIIGRDSSVLDVLADSLGGCIGAFIYPMKIWFKENKGKNI